MEGTIENNSLFDKRIANAGGMIEKSRGDMGLNLNNDPVFEKKRLEKSSDVSTVDFDDPVFCLSKNENDQEKEVWS